MTKKVTAFDNECVSKKIKPVFGIDLGTTNSAISIVREGKQPETIQLINGKFTMPSCVMYDHGEVVVGSKAYENRGKENVIYSVKRMMQDVNSTISVKDGNETITVRPAEVSAEILKGLVEQTGNMYGKIEDVIVTVPAYFNQNGVNATREACELAGLNLIAIANEPTAASLCYDLKPADSGEKDVIVYDLGGGTFDVTVMRILKNLSDSSLGDIYGFDDDSDKTDSSVITLGISGDMRLGGDDIDLLLLENTKKKLKAIGVDVDNIRDSYFNQLLSRIEQCKKSGIDHSYVLNIGTLGKDGRDIKTSVVLTPDDFREASIEIFNRTKEILDKLLSKTEHHADTIVLTGGSTKNPIIREAIAVAFPDYVIDDALSPDLSVSQGAAIQGYNTVCENPGIQIFDILPIAIGILNGEKVTSFIAAGTNLPTIKTLQFTTMRDNQQTLSVRLYQGDSSFPELCVPLGVLTIDGIPKQKAGEPNLTVTVKITADREMTCTASINGTKRELKLNLAGETSTQISMNDKAVKRFTRALKYIVPEKQELFRAMINQLGKKYSEEQLSEFLKENRSKQLDESGQ